MKYLWAAATHQGMVRENNEDAVFPTSAGETTDTAVLAVADGMGGHVAGEVASRIAINTSTSADLDASDRVAAGNRAIREEVAREPSLEGMGTTMTLMEIREDVGVIGHVGDSRAYMLRDGEFTQLTNDHTVAAEYVAIGQMSPEEAAVHPHRHMLTRTLGLTRFVNVDEVVIEFRPGDKVLLCSDGLTEMVSDDDISSLLAGGTPEENVWALIEKANAAGGVDNISVIVVHVSD